jgi:Tol biopolymer transport system component
VKTSRIGLLVLAAAGLSCSGDGPTEPQTVLRIAYTCVSGATTTKRDICAIDPDGTNKVTLISKTTNDDNVSWSPDGSKIAFTSDEFGPAALFTANADGTNQAALGGTNRAGQWPVWSPDGTTIAFSFNRGLWTIKSDGTGATQIAADTNGVGRPAWSPDGSKIAFGTEQRVGGARGIRIINKDGTGLTALAGTTNADAHPAYSPDGTKLAFSIVGTGIAVANVDGSSRVTIFPGTTATHPSWSPDGARLAFNNNGAPIRVWTMTAGGLDAKELPTGNILGGDLDPVWKSVQR